MFGHGLPLRTTPEPVGQPFWGMLHQSQRAPSPGLRPVGGCWGASAPFRSQGAGSVLGWPFVVWVVCVVLYVLLALRALYSISYTFSILPSSPAGTRLTVRCSFSCRVECINLSCCCLCLGPLLLGPWVHVAVDDLGCLLLLRRLSFEGF